MLVRFLSQLAHFQPSRGFFASMASSLSKLGPQLFTWSLTHFSLSSIILMDFLRSVFVLFRVFSLVSILSRMSLSNSTRSDLSTFWLSSCSIRFIFWKLSSLNDEKSRLKVANNVLRSLISPLESVPNPSAVN